MFAISFVENPEDDVPRRSCPILPSWTSPIGSPVPGNPSWVCFNIVGGVQSQEYIINLVTLVPYMLEETRYHNMSPVPVNTTWAQPHIVEGVKSQITQNESSPKLYEEAQCQVPHHHDFRPILLKDSSPTQYIMGSVSYRAMQICKRLRSPGIDSKESNPPGYIVWRNRLLDSLNV